MNIWGHVSASNKIRGITAVLRLAYRILLNPVFIVALFGPSCLIIAIRLIREEIGTAQVSQHIDFMRTFLNAPLVPGFVSYIIQYYTAIVVAAFWVFYWLQRGMLNDFKHLGSINRQNDVHHLLSIARATYTILGLLFALYCIRTLFLGGAAKVLLLEQYISRNPSFGTSTLPPFDSPFTWIRIIAGFHGATPQLLIKPNVN